ncbi:hypothetical protein DICVIV_11153 [Dictyocaulus viviparus]|uniref:Ras modification protein ERF4 n=1 Tax=Dictyocaulus viviparus TaxID=29172 RepID=A0A0D8XKJ1_DICVI|nr:hypothetical protein DICVIV_11153 [Dictyocaulus viviparus]
MVMASPPQPLTKNGVTVHEMRTIQMESCRKIFIPRDYSQGLNVHFETHFPVAFRGKISEGTWENTICSINSIFAEAEKVCCATILETLLGCATCYFSRLISDTIYEKKMRMLTEFIDKENQQTYNPAGFHIVNPMDRGLRTVCGNMDFIRLIIRYRCTLKSSGSAERAIVVFEKDRAPLGLTWFSSYEV